MTIYHLEFSYLASYGTRFSVLTHFKCTKICLEEPDAQSLTLYENKWHLYFHGMFHNMEAYRGTLMQKLFMFFNQHIGYC